MKRIICICLMILIMVPFGSKADDTELKPYTVYYNNQIIPPENGLIRYDYEEWPIVLGTAMVTDEYKKSWSSYINFKQLLALLEIEYSGDASTGDIFLVDNQGNRYVCRTEISNAPISLQYGIMDFYVLYGTYNNNNLYNGYYMQLNPMAIVGGAKREDDTLYLCFETAEYFVKGMKHNYRVDENERKIYIDGPNTYYPTIMEPQLSDEEYEQMSLEEYDAWCYAYYEIRHTLLWNLLAKNFPKATVSDIVNAKLAHPHSVYQMILSLECFR